MDAIAEPFPFVVSSGPAVLMQGGGLLYGWACIETTGGAPATFDVLDCTDEAKGVLLAPIALSSGQSTRDPFATPLMIRTGLVIGNVTGDVRGALWATPAWRLSPDVLATFGERL